MDGLFSKCVQSKISQPQNCSSEQIENYPVEKENDPNDNDDESKFSEGSVSDKEKVVNENDSGFILRKK